MMRGRRCRDPVSSNKMTQRLTVILIAPPMKLAAPSSAYVPCTQLELLPLQISQLFVKFCLDLELWSNSIKTHEVQKKM